MPKPPRQSVRFVRCPAEPAVAMIGGKWKIPILWHLFDGPKRFGELQRALAPITQKVLIQQLRDLEADALVTRTVYAEVPPRVDYALTDLGRSMLLPVRALGEWAAAHIPQMDAARQRYDATDR